MKTNYLKHYWLKTSVSYISQFGGSGIWAGLGSSLLHVASTEVIGECSGSRWAGREDPRQLCSHVWCTGWEGWRPGSAGVCVPARVSSRQGCPSEQKVQTRLVMPSSVHDTTRASICWARASVTKVTWVQCRNFSLIWRNNYEFVAIFNILKFSVADRCF